MLKFVGYLVASIFGVIMVLVICAVIITLMTGLVRAQHEHAQYHPFYKNWVNKNGGGCCNDRDCKPAEDKITAAGVEVLVEGQWCPVYSWHYLKAGNAPDASIAHACVAPRIEGGPASPCARLICYQPKPLF